MTRLEIAKNFIEEFIKSNPLVVISGDILNSALDKLINAVPDESVLAGGFVDTLKISDTEPTEGWEKGVYILGDVGAYSQGFTTEEGNFNIASFDGLNWKMTKIEIQSGNNFLKLAQGGTIPSINLFNINDPTIQNDKGINPTANYDIQSFPGQGFKVSGWMPLLPSMQYTILNMGLSSKAFQFTDANKIKLNSTPGQIIGPVGGPPNVPVSFITPANCYGGFYMCKSTNSAEPNINPALMLVKGTGLKPDGSQIDFVPFGDVTNDGNEIIPEDSSKKIVAGKLEPGTKMDGKTVATMDDIFNVLKGKKIAIYGTSITAGYPNHTTPELQNVYSYFNRAVLALGGIPLNYSVPYGVIRSAKSNGGSMNEGSVNRDVLSFTRTQSAINYQVSILEKLNTSDEPDLHVFELTINDIQVDATDFNSFPSLTTLNTNTFIGAYNFVFQQLFASKKDAKVLIVTHYSNDSSASPNEYIKVNEALESIANKWGIRVLKMYQKSQIVNNGIKTDFGPGKKLPDYVHPGSDETQKTVEELADILKEDLISIFS